VSQHRYCLFSAVLLVQIALAQDQPRVYLQAASYGNTWAARRDQSIEMAKDFQKRCPRAALTISQEKADYIVILNHLEVGLLVRDNQIEVANKDGDVLSTLEKGGIRKEVEDICRLILADWQKHLDPKPTSPAVTPAPAPLDDSVSARQDFAEAADNKLRNESAGFAEVVNTTLVVHSIYADKEHYDSLVGDQKFTTELRRRGFAEFVYTNDRKKTFRWQVNERAPKSPFSF
jgi:hypothetical protein